MTPSPHRERTLARTPLGAFALLIVSASMAQAGALDRTGQPVTILFEDGNFVELGYAATMPHVDGTFAGSVDSGSMAPDYSLGFFGLKYDVTDRLSLALTVDEPFGADVDYDESEAGYPLAGSEADFRTRSVTALARYRINEAFSVHGGLRYVEVDADLTVNALTATPAGPALVSYDSEYDSDGDTGYVVGAAYERPAIALRVALTYSSKLEYDNEARYTVTSPLGAQAGSGPTVYELPQSVNLDFRIGVPPSISRDTAVIAGVRWVDWSETEINTPGYPFGEPVVDYDGDYVTYVLGLGRRFTDQFSALASVAYEDGIGGPVSNLSPTDGQVALIVGGSYALGNRIELGAAVRYARLGDATTQTIGAEFEDNDATSLVLRVGYRF